MAVVCQSDSRPEPHLKELVLGDSAILVYIKALKQLVQLLDGVGNSLQQPWIPQCSNLQ